jgi:hypothetical protein
MLRMFMRSDYANAKSDLASLLAEHMLRMFMRSDYANAKFKGFITSAKSVGTFCGEALTGENEP